MLKLILNLIIFSDFIILPGYIDFAADEVVRSKMFKSCTAINHVVLSNEFRSFPVV